MNNSKDKFQIITLCEKFLCRFCETLKGCDKEYRETIVRDLYLDIKKLMCTVQYANDRLKRGSPKRLELQYSALQTAENLITMLDSVCRLCRTGAKKQAALVKDLCLIRDKLSNWYTSDLGSHNQYLLNQYTKVREEFNKSKDIYYKINDWCKKNPSEKNREALEQSKSYCRALKDKLVEAKAAYDRSTAKLSENASTDYTLMGQVLKEIETQTNRKGK